MEGLIDLHAHVLPGLDDGPETLPEALALLRAMAEQGVRAVVATPHAADDIYRTRSEQVQAGVAALQAAADAEQLGIQIFPGQELLLGPGLSERLQRGELLPIGDGPYICVELPRSIYPLYADRAFFDLLVAGYRPLLIHPERNRGIQGRPERMAALAEQGVLGIVTAGSLLGHFGSTAERLARRFLKEGTAPLVASDAHDLQRRPPLLAAALRVAETLGKTDQRLEWELIGCSSSAKSGGLTDAEVDE